MNFDIWKLQTPNEIKNWFNFLRKDLRKNNDCFFHYTEKELKTYLKNPDLNLSERLFTFIKYWGNFNNRKRCVQRFFKFNKLNVYPDCFKNNERIIIKEIDLDFNNILEEINVLKINNKKIPYSYEILLKKLIKSILYNKVFINQQIQYLDINLEQNLIIIEYKFNEIKLIKKQYKLNKFLLKYQNIYPDEYKHCKAWLIISCNWQDIFLQSTFKSWVSCMNLINTYSNARVKYSNENNVKSRQFSCIFNIKFRRSEKVLMRL